jgi:two-component system response regulator VicR
MKIMLADDEENIRELVRLVLVERGFEVCECADGAEAIDLFGRAQPDLAILDVIMPRATGFEVCEQIRLAQPDVPVIFLSAKGDIVDKKSGYKVGADDYMTKPFDVEELLLRVEALLRRSGKASSGAEAGVGVAAGTGTGMGAGGSSNANAGVLAASQGEPFAVNGLEFNLRRYDVTKSGSKIDLAPKEFQILVLLAEHKGELFTREDIVQQVWGEEYLDSAINVAVYIRHIRQKIEEDPAHPKLIQTVRRVGYRFGE